MSGERCVYCEGRWDRPGLYDCKDGRHPPPTLAQRIVADIESELGNRRLGWGGIEAEVADELRDRLDEIVRRRLEAVL